MSKQVIVLAPDVRPDRRRRLRALPILSLFVAASLLAPIIIDAASLCYGQWREMLGDPVPVRTPALDAIGERVAEVREEFRYQFVRRFHQVPWDHRVVLGISVVVMVVAVLMLRL